MENIEIILTEFDKNQIDDFINQELKLSSLTVLSSHFYDDVKEKDLEFYQVQNIKEIISPRGSGSICLKELYLGSYFTSVVLMLSFGKKDGRVLFNFPANSQNYNRDNLEKLISYALNLKTKYTFTKIIIGFEPAEDEDEDFRIFSGDSISPEDKNKLLEGLYFKN